MFDSDLVADAAQLHALAARIACRIDASTPGAVAVEALTEMFAAVRQGELGCARLIERADRSGEYAIDGAASVTAFVRRTAHESSAWASRRVRIGRALADSLPATSAAWERGELGLDHAGVIDGATRKLCDGELVESLDSYLSLLAATVNPRELAAASEDLLSQAAPEETAAENAKRRAAQTLHLSQTSDGMWRLDGWLDSEAGHILAAALGGFLRKPSPDGDLLTESVGRRRADALIDMCRQGVTHAAECDSQGMARFTVVAGLMHQQLVDLLGTAGISGGSNIPAAAARRMACEANLIPAVYGADSEAVDFGRSMRLASAGLRRKINVRDGGCTFPDCDRPPSMCEAHHRDEWFRHKGKTSDLSLELVCSFHHHLVHEGEWTITLGQDPHRTPWFRPPDGRPPLQGQRRALIHRSDRPIRS